MKVRFHSPHVADGAGRVFVYRAICFDDVKAGE